MARKINLSTLEKVRPTDFKRARAFWGNSIKILVRVDEKDVGTKGPGFYRLPEKSSDSACIGRDSLLNIGHDAPKPNS